MNKPSGLPIPRAGHAARAGLSIQSLRVGYDGADILHNISLHVPQNQTLALMGPSGCGKTTLLLSILGIVSPREGRIQLDGRDLLSLPIEQRKIGYLPQDFGLFPHLSVIQNVSYGLMVRGAEKEEQDRIAREMLSLLDLKGFENRKPGQLSGGQKQRVALGRALAIRPDLLLLDEPLANIDQLTRFEVAGQLKALFKKLGMPIILVTHNREDAIFFGEHIAVMVGGKMEQIGNAKTLIRSPKTEAVRKLLLPFKGV